ncbi:MAG: IS1380 family transposase [bacterium]|nr:IS1380 family transposase [bacterium]
MARFDQPDSSSDAGAVLLSALDERLGLTRALAGALTDRRSADRVRHSLHDVLRQRIYGIACGYEDNNDAARLRHDPAQKLLLGRDPLVGAVLASQPTLSRFENGVGARGSLRMATALADCVIERHRRRLGRRVKRITIDLDGTDDPTHGQQQGALWNGFYGGFCYLPLVGTLQFDRERDQYLFAALLRPGNASGKSGAITLLRRVLPRLRTAFPNAHLRVRLDGGFAAPDIFDYLEREGVEYVVAMGSNPVLARLAEPLLERAREASRASGKSERVYGHAQYQTRNWPHARRVVIKGEVTRYPEREPRDNPRFVITNIPADPQVVYHRIYAQRGDVENRLKELHDGIAFGRLSCTRFLANQARLLLYAAAFVIYQELRLAAHGTDLARAQVTTLRERLIKLAGWFGHAKRRIVLHLPQDAPWRHEWASIANHLQATT